MVSQSWEQHHYHRELKIHMQNMPDNPEDSGKMLGHALGRILCYLLYAEYE